MVENQMTAMCRILVGENNGPLDGFSSLSSSCDPGVCEDGAYCIGWALGLVDPKSEVATSRHVTGQANGFSELLLLSERVATGCVPSVWRAGGTALSREHVGFSCSIGSVQSFAFGSLVQNEDVKYLTSDFIHAWFQQPKGL